MNREETQSEVQSAPRRRRFRGWHVVLIGAVVLAIGSDDPSEIPRIAAVAWGDLLFLNFTVNFLPALLLPFAGYAVDRWSPRRMAALGLVTIGVGLILHTGAEWIVWVSHLSILMLIVGGVLGTLLPMATAVNNRFHRRRATAMGAMLAAALAFVALTLLKGAVAYRSLYRREACC